MKKEVPLSPKPSVRIYVPCLIMLDPQAEPSTFQKETVIERQSFRDDLRGRTAGGVIFCSETVNQRASLPTQVSRNSETSLVYLLKLVKQFRQ